LSVLDSVLLDAELDSVLVEAALVLDSMVLADWDTEFEAWVVLALTLADALVAEAVALVEDTSLTALADLTVK
jgi:hypothetical protein